MLVNLLTIVFFMSILSQLLKSNSQLVDNFTYNGFHRPLTLISLQGKATVTPTGLLKLTRTTMHITGHAFYNQPIRFKDSPNDTVSSFSTTFIFAIKPQNPTLSGDGMAFVMAPTSSLSLANSGEYLGLFNSMNNGNKIKPLASFLFIIEVMIPIVFISLLIFVLVRFIIRRRRKFAEEVEDWDTESSRTNRFKFKDLYYATKGFKDKNILGSGGFGSVYKGVMPKTKKEIAVKRVSNQSRQGLKEFVSEIMTIGRMSHRNLVTLLGYCRLKKELLLVYDYMPNGSLDKYLYNNSPEVTLEWKHRCKVVKGVASALFYLHEDWEQVVIHRDIKASNVLLDADHNGRLGDFGLARLCGHGTDPLTTRVAGTWGYLAPDLMRTGKATTATDVFAFGVLLLEVACGRRPIEIYNESGEWVLLVDWVFGFWSEGNILDAKDPNLGTEYDQREVEMVLKLGLLCSHSNPHARPTMRQVLHYLCGDAVLPDISPFDLHGSEMMLETYHGFSEIGMFTCESSLADSVLSNGR